MEDLKLFEQFQQSSKLDDFYDAYKKLLMDETEYDEGDEPSNYDLWTEVGQLTNEYDLSKEDVGKILSDYDISFDINHFLQSTYDYWESDKEHLQSHDNLNRLVRKILDAAKLDVNRIEEADPEFIGHISDMILKWHNENR